MEEGYKETNHEDPDLPANDSNEPERSKAAEIFKGIGLAILIVILFSSLPWGGGIAWIFFLLLYAGLIVFCYVKGRNGIGLGMIIAALIPIAIFGGCLILIGLN